MVIFSKNLFQCDLCLYQGEMVGLIVDLADTYCTNA